MWSEDSYQPRLTLRHEKAVHSAEFSPDGRRIITASRDRTARLWDAATGQSLGTTMPHSDSVNSARFSSDGKWVVTGCDDGTIGVWDGVTGAAVSESARLTNASRTPGSRLMVERPLQKQRTTPFIHSARLAV